MTARVDKKPNLSNGGTAPVRLSHRRIKEELGNMSLQVEKLEKNIEKLTIEATAEEFEKAVQKAYQKNKS